VCKQKWKYCVAYTESLEKKWIKFGVNCSVNSGLTPNLTPNYVN